MSFDIQLEMMENKFIFSGGSKLYRYSGTNFLTSLGLSHSPYIPPFGPGQTFTTIKRFGHGWTRLQFRNAYHNGIFPSWNKHATMPLMRIAVCFDGCTTTDDRIYTKPFQALSLSLSIPHLPYYYVMPFYVIITVIILFSYF